MYHYTYTPMSLIKLKFLFLFLCILWAAAPIKAQGNPATTGSGYCIDFTPNIANNNYVDLGSLTAIDTGNFSIEMWVNVNACKNDPPFFSNKDWSSGNNTGIVFDVHDNGTKLRVNLKTNTSSFQNIIIPINGIGRGWFHLAVTLDRQTYLKIYIDGVLKSALYMMTPLAGSFASAYTYKLGQDGTGNYTDDNGLPIHYDGKLDEIRIWKTERSIADIRNNMCKKISPLASGLYAYYNCDATTGDSLKDLTGHHPGKWIKGVADSWKLSGAAIGDTSVNLYPNDVNWDNLMLRLSDTLLGACIVKNILTTTGLHLYQVKSLPNSLNGLKTYPANANYFGIYMADPTPSSTCEVDLDYSNYTAAVTDRFNLKLFTRNQNSDHTWSEFLAQQDLAGNILAKKPMNSIKREFILGTKAGLSCPAPSELIMSNQTDSSCMVGWTTGGSNQWDTEWGIKGFELGTGNYATITTNPQTVNGLKKGSFYEFYVQDKCSSTTSYWVGPFSIYPQSCLSATDFKATQITDKSVLLSWKGNGSKSDVEWGLVGFTLGQGIPDSTFNDTLLLKGLASNTTYAYYVKSNCANGSNAYNGPFIFKTKVKDGIAENELLNAIRIFPNPSAGEFTMLVNTESKTLNVRIFNVLGKEIYQALEINKNGVIRQTYHLNEYPKGIYFITVTNGIAVATKSIVIE
jgi:hypothetical protein